RVRRRAPEIDVAVRRPVRLHERDPLAFGRDRGNVETRVVLVDEPAVAGLRVVAIEVEELRVTLVRLDPEGPPIRAPAVELRLQLLAGRQVPLLAVELPHVEVIQLVAALVARVEDTVVPRELGDRVRRA